MPLHLSDDFRVRAAAMPLSCRFTPASLLQALRLAVFPPPLRAADFMPDICRHFRFIFTTTALPDATPRAPCPCRFAARSRRHTFFAAHYAFSYCPCFTFEPPAIFR